MKNKHLTAIFSLALLLIAASAHAQIPYANNTAASSVNWFVGTTNLATPLVLDVRKTSNVALSITMRGATTATNIIAMGWSNSNGSTYSTNSADRIIWAPDSLSAISTTKTTNIACGAYAYLVIYNVTATQTSTNTITWSTKGL